MKKVGLYLRVSTTEQFQEGYSIPAQKERLINFCKAQDWAIHDIYIDGGYTGSNINRPALQRLINDIQKVDIVLVYKLDRLSRSQRDTLYLIEDVFLKNDVDFVSMSESFDTSTPFGKAITGILSIFAQLERETIKERTKTGKIQRAKQGLYHGGKLPPIGYDYVDGKLIINEYEAMQVRKVFEMYLKGIGGDKIAQLMREAGYTYKAGSWKNGPAVRNVLVNPIYIGKLAYDGNVYDGQHEAILPVEIFEQAQKRRIDRQWSADARSDYLLTGLLYCAHCGSRYCVKWRKERQYITYSCYSRTKMNPHMIKDPNCKNKHWLVDKLDLLVEEELFTMAETWDEKLYKKKPKPVNNQKLIQGKLAEIDKQIEKLMDLYQIESIPFEQVGKRIEKLHNEKTALEKQLQEEAPAETDYDEVRELLKKGLPMVWVDLTMAEKRQILRSLINRIDIYNDKIKIEWSF
jgi:site-specific DNA recombinase